AKKLADFHKISERKVIDKSSESMKDYYKFVKEIVGIENLALIKKSGLKVLIDPNGGTGIAAISLLKEIGVSTVSINNEYGQFNRAVEPTEDSLFYLGNILKGKNADFAAGFDCDADRVEIMMGSGKLISGNYVLALVVDYILSSLSNPKGKIVVVNDATSSVVKKVAEKYGAKIREVEVGETNVVSEMYKLKSPVGGEGSSSGAITPPSRCRDGILTLVQILSIVSKKKESIEKIVDTLPKFCTLREKMEFDSKKHDEIKKFLKNYYTKKGFEIKETGGIKGGLKAVDGNSFIWFRASKTEGNVFRIISDSDNLETAQSLLKEAVEVFGKVK
ncbi:MAG TPA: hypothetical protein VI564_08085, partial [Candidatus Nanoarchaeia archaeon]|nr:hypothetical protein [Candidatus Nanoarchaeia archaeon]